MFEWIKLKLRPGIVELDLSDMPVLAPIETPALDRLRDRQPFLPRCESRKHEGPRSWRCTRDAGHDVDASPLERLHINLAGGRRW